MTQHFLWTEAVDRLRSRVSPQNYDTWLRPIEVSSWEGETLRLRAPNSFVRVWFESHFLAGGVIELRELGAEVRIEFEPDGNNKMPEGRLPNGTQPEQLAHGSVPTQLEEAAPAVLPPAHAMSSGQIQAMTEDAAGIRVPDNATLNPRYSFETFVAGPSNQLAFAASQAAASSYPPKYNPVFICGGAGLGKTHLLHAIGHQQLSNRPSSRIVYISSERFMNEYVQAIRSGKMNNKHHNNHKNNNKKHVDDVQFLAGKESTQDEFFHTFNALHENHKQIVLTSDRKPHEISDIADRLRTRFAWGLLAAIEPPVLVVCFVFLCLLVVVVVVSLPDDSLFFSFVVVV